MVRKGFTIRQFGSSYPLTLRFRYLVNVLENYKLRYLFYFTFGIVNIVLVFHTMPVLFMFNNPYNEISRFFFLCRLVN